MLHRPSISTYPPRLRKKHHRFGIVFFLVGGVICVWIGISLATKTQSRPQSAEEHLQRAQQKFDAGRYNETIAICYDALDRDPDLVEAYVLSANACLALSDTVQALQFLDSGFKQTHSQILQDMMDDIHANPTEDGS
jgi:tetratricopeptide (TPR) repeat protein